MDIVAVSSAAACEKRSYVYRGRTFERKRDLKIVFPNLNEEEIEVLVEPAPLAHARQCARQLLQSLLDACAPVADYRGYVTGEGNFRYEIATIQPYKGNRDASASPVWRRDVEEYLLRDWNTERCEGYEADDRLAVEFTKNPRESILCSQDKDFLQIENLRMYNWRDKKHITVTPEQGRRSFYGQMLTGDDIDNIPGVPGIGPAKADKLLGSITDERLLATVVYSAYQKGYGPKAWEAYQENARLLWLIKTEEGLKNPKKAWRPVISPDGAQC
jgi:hypothetical protein